MPDVSTNADDFLPGQGSPGLVSVIIPAYNRARSVRFTIDSVLASSYENFEVIIVDDGSTDDTDQRVKTYTDPRVRYFKTKNGGLSAARNFGLAQSRGEFIAFLDSDDGWMPWKLAAQIEFLRKHAEVGVIWSDMSTFTSDPSSIVHDRYIRTYYQAYQRIDIERTLKVGCTLGDVSNEAPAKLRTAPIYVGDVFREMFLGSLVHPSTAVVRRTRLRQAGPFDFALTGPGAEDYHFYYRISSYGPVAFLDAPTTLYQIGDASALSARTLAQARGNLNVVLHWLSRQRPELPSDVVTNRVASSYRWAGREELLGGDCKKARHHLLASLRMHPDPGAVGLFVISLLPQGSVPVLRALKHVVMGKRISAGLMNLALVVPAELFVNRAVTLILHVGRIAYVRR